MLRASATSAEDVLWSALRNRQLAGWKFVRQFPIGPFIVDLVCREVGMVIEVDGATHATSEEVEQDAQRTRSLEALGFVVWRVGNGEVYDNLDGILETLLHELGALAKQRGITSPSPRERSETGRGSG